MKTLNQGTFLFVCVAALFAFGTQAGAATVGFGLKWSQPVIEIDPTATKSVFCGWDESSFSVVPFVTPRFELRKIVADDFRCLGNMPITSAHWWGSYKGWDLFDPPKDRPVAWLIGFWSNVPADPQAHLDFSYPQTLLWQIRISAARVSEEPVGTNGFPGKFSDVCYQYSAQLKADEYFVQADYRDATLDDVFWISIAAVYKETTLPAYMWGWKSRPRPWMDDAVTFDVVGELKPGFSPSVGTIRPLTDSAICGQPESYDMAFELGTDPDHIKWEQSFTGIRDWAHYEDQESMTTGDDDIVDGAKWFQEPDLSQLGLDVDATADFPPIWPPVTVADDFLCTTTGPVTNISVWSSFFEDQLPGNGADSIQFTVSIHSSSTYPGQIGAGKPNRVLWSRQFRRGEYDLGIYAENLAEGWYAPALDSPNYQPLGDAVCWKYDFTIDPADAFVQQGTPDNPTVYWLSVQGFIVHPPGSIATRFGWKTSRDNWNAGAVWGPGEDMPTDSDAWRRLTYPGGHLLGGENIDVAFEILTQADTPTQPQGPAVRRLVADDWLCDTETPVTALAWWGSYLGYKFQACQCPQEPAPARPDYFLLSIWTDVPASSLSAFSHPAEKIWEYKAFDFDEVLVGYDKHSQLSTDPAKVAHEPVFRYCARLPEDGWFSQGDIGRAYWLSVVAVYTDPETIDYPWGWTNHEYVFRDAAAAGHVDSGGAWQWEALEEQTGKAADMSFVLFGGRE